MTSFCSSDLIEIRMMDVTVEEGGTDAVLRIFGRIGGMDGESENRQGGTTFMNKVSAVLVWYRDQFHGTFNLFEDIKKYMKVWHLLRKMRHLRRICLWLLTKGPVM